MNKVGETLKKKRIYLDLCALQRPYDDQSFPRIEAETAAVTLITTFVKRKEYVLMYSPIHADELQPDKDEAKCLEIQKFLQTYGENISSSFDYPGIEARGLMLEILGFGIADAMHVAYAEASSAEFITCDDDLLRKCQHHNVKKWSGTPIDFGKKEGLL